MRGVATFPVLKHSPPPCVLCPACLSSNRDLNGFGAASKAANYISELHLENTFSAVTSARAGQGRSRAAAPFRSEQARARAAAPFCVGQGIKTGMSEITGTAHAVLVGWPSTLFNSERF
jgi:hypothetical protein